MRGKCPHCDSTRGVVYEVIGKEQEWVQKQWKCDSCGQIIGVTESPSKKIRRKLKRL
ncbi:putative Zn finger protein [Halarchaeum solikamskense]|nr:putative Zn finger protein [Halarchaeum solikamskense]